MKSKAIICQLVIAFLCFTDLQAQVEKSCAADRSDFRDESIYFVMTTRFYDGDASNNFYCKDNWRGQESANDPAWRGDFKGLIEKLDYIKALGFTSIWITPVVQNHSDYDYHGYHAVDFSKVDSRYESEDCNFQDLIDAVHAKGMKLILDVVFNHCSDYGEKYFNQEFDSIAGTYEERIAMMQNLDGVNHDYNNYWHHKVSDCSWIDHTRWWRQIANQCVDLNTENPAVYNYLLGCYKRFIRMGVDAFRIDTAGHLGRLTFNRAFIPALAHEAELYADKRQGRCPFYMFGEVCVTQDKHVTNSGHPSMSAYFYTWKSDSDLLERWNEDADIWRTLDITDNTDLTQLPNIGLCIEEALRYWEDGSQPVSMNAIMIDGKYHEADTSRFSGLNVIDFPMHMSFSTAMEAYQKALEGDKYYNDATWNVVYVDSHDFAPFPHSGVRFNGGTEQWMENLNLLFTFRGIPCLYYGSEVEFQAGMPIDAGPNRPLSQSGRAYYGDYLEGTVRAKDFGVYEASGRVDTTLSQPLSQHIIFLNKIRSSVPALRKGQWTNEDCMPVEGGIAFKRAWKDSYALVCLNGGAVFKNCPAGTYTDIITGEKYDGPVIKLTASAKKGELHILVKDWSGNKIEYPAVKVK